MELTAAEGRVLGALVEKELTTPQAYPLTDSALIAACNQATSRDPVVQYDVGTVRVAVRSLREQGLLRTVHRTGERSDKHRHELTSALGVSTPQTALLAVLLLRGPQTAAELRARTERLHAFDGVDEVLAELAALAERDEPLVERLARQPGRKEARYAQRLAQPTGAGEGAAAGHGGERASAGEVAGPDHAARDDAEPDHAVPDHAGRGERPDHAGPPSPDADAVLLREEVAGLRERLAGLAEEVSQLRHEVSELRAERG